MRPAGGLLPFQHNELEFSTTRMSALGHKRTSRRCCLMSALPPKSGHWNSAVKCPLCAKSRHTALQQIRRRFRPLRAQTSSVEFRDGH